MALYVESGGGSQSLQAISENFVLPVEEATAPDMLSRRAAIKFTTAANNENLVLDTITYTFVTNLGNPAANNVHVKVQGSVSATIKILANAIRGITDANNITFGVGTNPHPTITGYWTGQKVSVGSVGTIAAGNNLFLLEKTSDVVTAITFTSTTTHAKYGFSRQGILRYTLDGNHALDGTQSIRGNYQTVFPIGSIIVGGQTATVDDITAYTVTELYMPNTSGTGANVIEVDFYYSLDEVTFTRVSRSSTLWYQAGIPVNNVRLQSSRVPTGAGLYLRCGTDGTGAADYIDVKISYHLYPKGV